MDLSISLHSNYLLRGKGGIHAFPLFRPSLLELNLWRAEQWVRQLAQTTHEDLDQGHWVISFHGADEKVYPTPYSTSIDNF